MGKKIRNLKHQKESQKLKSQKNTRNQERPQRFHRPIPFTKLAFWPQAQPLVPEGRRRLAVPAHLLVPLILPKLLHAVAAIMHFVEVADHLHHISEIAEKGLEHAVHKGKAKFKETN